MADVVRSSLRREVRARALRRRALVGSTSLVAAALLVFLLSPMFGRDEPSLVNQPMLVSATGEVKLLSPVDARFQIAHTGMPLSPGVEVRTGAGASAELLLSTGAHVGLKAATTMRLGSGKRGQSHERVGLRLGRMDVRVPKLEKGQALSVVTPHATITVHGTEFSVHVTSERGDLLTSVRVVSGRVEVQALGQHVWLEGGQQWSSRTLLEASRSSTAADAALTDSVQAPELRPASESGPVASSTTADSGERSLLALQNRLLEQALKKARSGRQNEALTDLERLLHDHPRSPLTQSVRVEHFRLLRELGKTAQAAREARRYLSDYPNGFARDDAKQTALLGVDPR